MTTSEGAGTLSEITDIWDPYLSERDRALFLASGYGAKPRLGDRPAVLVIDVTYEFTGPSRQPVISVVREHPNACGEEAWDAVARMRRLIDAARAAAVPVLYTRGDPAHPLLDRASWAAKNPRLLDRTGDDNVIVKEIEPAPDDPVITKVKPSGFFGTPLAQYLTVLGVDQLICCGGTTSGCVRATVVDAFSHGYRTAVAADASFDRGEASHAIGLFDMAYKYANVMTTDDLVAYLADVRPR